MSVEPSGSWGRVWTTLCRALKRRLLARSSQEYMQRFTGSDPGTDRALAAQRLARAKRPLASQQIGP
jgi:hypothetical protein